MYKLYTLKLNIYQTLVNRHAGIRQRYHSYHENAGYFKKITSWLYLLVLNFAYYFLHLKFLGTPKQLPLYEEKAIPFYNESESHHALKSRLTIEQYTQQLKPYDIISFDIFDTLVFRPFSEPTDLFYLLGERLEFMDMKHIRMEAEAQAREIHFQKYNNYEVTLDDIWELMEQKTGIAKEKGITEELSLELELCFANPFMKQLYNTLLKMNKKIIAISDMYLQKDFLRKLLDANGYNEISEIYVSCEHGKSKSNGELYTYVLNNEAMKYIKTPHIADNRISTIKTPHIGDNPITDIKTSHTGTNPISAIKIAHIGDNLISDIKMAHTKGITAFHYPNINKAGQSYRPYDMSYITGSAYRGLVNSYILNGAQTYTPEYEYGFIYGGLFVLGYCHFIHDYAAKNNIDKILFLSRDGDILKQVYDYIYNDNTAYFYWSRKAAVKLMAAYDKNDYFRRFLYHNINKEEKISDLLRAMELTDIINSWEEPLSLNEKLTDKNVNVLKDILERNWHKVIQSYSEQSIAAKKCMESTLKNCKKACAVDIGWAGSGAMSLRKLAKAYGISCEITGIVAGTNTIHNNEPDAAEPFLQSGKLAAYMYSHSHNRDLMKKHDLNKGWNLYWELLLSSPQRQFTGYYSVPETNAIHLKFGEYDKNTAGIKEIQQGILDFAHIYMRHFGSFPYMLNISGRDAYAPMLAAAGKNEKYLKELYKNFYIDSSI